MSGMAERRRMATAGPRLAYLGRGLRLVWESSRGWTIGSLVLLVAGGLLPVASVFLVRELVDAMVVAIDTAGDSAAVRRVIVMVLAMAGVMVGTEAARALGAWMRIAQAEAVQDHVSGRIHERALALDLAFYESPSNYDRLHRARIDAVHQPVSLLENLGALLQNGITFVAMALVLVPFGVAMPLVLLLSTLPALFVAFRHTLVEHQWWMQNTAAMRRSQYYDWIITLRDAAAELRVFALGDMLRERFQAVRARLRSERVGLARKKAGAELVASFLGLASAAGATVWMATRAVAGVVSLGELAMFWQAFSRGQQMLRVLLETSGKVYGNSLFLENLFEFLDTQKAQLDRESADNAAGRKVPEILANGFEFADVSFSYPGSEHRALDDCSLLLPAGKITALVGDNGSGKTTLSKLLCGFYQPDQGRVTLDGVDLATYDTTDLWRRITVMFQKPVEYQESAEQNIAFGDIAGSPGSSEVEQAARSAGADVAISRLPQGYQTVLGKWFGGAELSGGEWQRVALARAFVRQASLVVLDEPTSAMDSWAEGDWLARFRTLVAGRTTLLISHRFTTAMQADAIHVLENGRVIESGSHTELLELGGRYALSWNEQMSRAKGGAHEAENDRSAEKPEGTG